MQSKPLYMLIFDILDYADEIIKLISSESHDKNSYFLTLVYIEDILDSYGRSLIADSAKEYASQGTNPDNLLTDATKRMDALRKIIRAYSQQYNFDEALKLKGQQIYQDWHKLPEN